MQSYMQELHPADNPERETSHDSRVLVDIEHELQEEINRTESQIAKCAQEIKQITQSLSPRSVADANATADDATAVNQRYDRRNRTAHPLCSSTPATVERSSVKRLSQTWPSDIGGSHHAERVVDVSHLLHTSVEEISVHDVYARSASPERHSYSQGVGHLNTQPFIPHVDKQDDVDFPPEDYVPRRYSMQDQQPDEWQWGASKPHQHDAYAPSKPHNHDAYVPSKPHNHDADVHVPAMQASQGYNAPGSGHVDSYPKETPSHGDDTAGLLHKLADLLSNRRDNLPRMEPEVFTGELLRFPVWIKSFDAIIESHTDSPSERLYFLSKYTSGAARESIEGFFSQESEEAYIQAKHTLMSRFGDRYKVSEAFKKKLNDWPTIRPGDAEGLRKFSDFLQHCSSAMTSITYLDSLNSAEENRKLVVKLPRYIADRWNRVIDRWLYKDERGQSSYLMLTQGRYPPFSAFCQFIEDEARVACGPGNVSSLSTKKDTQDKKAGSFTSQTNARNADKSNKDVQPEKSSAVNKTPSQPQSCLFCKSPHTTDRCQKFLQKPADEKKTFASAHGLCFGCLRRGHLYSSCRNKNPYLMKDATTEASHADQEKPQEKPPDDKDATDSAMSLRTDARDVLDDGNNCVHSMILPVIVHHNDDPDNEILTYALLDNQSDACFVGDNLLQQLKTTSERVTLELTTVLAKQVVESQVVRGLVVTGLHQDVEIPLPATYSRNCIPASKNLIPRPETVQQWPHLRDVELHPLQENTEIGLLIGINCSRALLPREVVAAGDDDPYAIRTALGWGVTGNMSPSTDDAEGHGSSSHFAFRTSAKEITPVEVRQMFEQSSTNQRLLLHGQLELHQHDIKDNPADIASQGFLRNSSSTMRHAQFIILRWTRHFLRTIQKSRK